MTDLHLLSLDQLVELHSLRYHWSSAYDIDLRHGRWTAQCRVTGDVMVAGSEPALRQLIRSHYANVAHQDKHT